MHRLDLITTERLLLRRWQPEDRAPFAALNANPDVMRYFPALLTREQSDRVIDNAEAHFDTHGFGLWAVERRTDGALLGFVGLQHVPLETAFTPAVEIAWRLAASAWGRGYATEAATAVRDAAFAELDLDEILALAVPANTASIAVMRRLGMQHDPELDFDHPRLDPSSPYARHVVYRFRRAGMPAPSVERGDFVHDLRHAHSVELRPDSELDNSIRSLALQLEQDGLLTPGAATAPRFHPHLTLLRAREVSVAALDAVTDMVAAHGAAVSFDTAGTFGDGRIIWLAPRELDVVEQARRVLLERLPHADIDPLVTSRSWTPHLTVAYAVPERHHDAALERVRAALPLAGAWQTVEAWHLDERPTRRIGQRRIP